MALHEDRRHVGIETDREQHGCQPHGGVADHAGGLGDGQGMEIDDPVKGIGVVLAIDPVAQGPEVVAQVDFTGRLDAREHAGHGAPG
jgi:hypothetical protein